MTSDPMQEVVERLCPGCRDKLPLQNGRHMYAGGSATEKCWAGEFVEAYSIGRRSGAEWMRGEAAKAVKDHFECDCGCPKSKYNTESGHAMNCDHYEALNCARAIESLPLLPEGKKEPR